MRKIILSRKSAVDPLIAAVVNSTGKLNPLPAYLTCPLTCPYFSCRPYFSCPSLESGSPLKRFPVHCRKRA
jgi:hypothetical protein